MVSHYFLLIFIIQLSQVSVHGQSETISLGEFNRQYSVHMNYVSRFSTRVSLNLLQGNNFFIHVNPRYKDDGGCNARSAFVMNNRVNGAWQREIRPSIPFVVNNVPTSIAIVPNRQNYGVFVSVNGKRFITSFPFRNNQAIERINNARTYTGSRCGKTPPVVSMAVGYTIDCVDPSSTTIDISATSRSSVGTIVIDLAQGLPKDKVDAFVPLRIRVTSTNIQFMRMNGNNQLVRVSTVSNTGQLVAANKDFSVRILLGNANSFQVDINSRKVATVPANDYTGTSTVFVSGVSKIQRIRACTGCC